MNDEYFSQTKKEYWYQIFREITMNKNQQIYEDYWEITNEYGYNSERFVEALRICVEYIDEIKSVNPSYTEQDYSSEIYHKLQARLQSAPALQSTRKGFEGKPKNEASVRKSINQLVKSGFISPFLTGYHSLTKEYLQTKVSKKRKFLFSRVVYESSNFSYAITDKPNIKVRHINFLVNTLIENPEGKLCKNEIIALMLIDLRKYTGTFYPIDELRAFIFLNQDYISEFADRKYNQINYLWSLLSNLDEIYQKDDAICLEEDKKRIFGDIEDTQSNRKRDPYLHRLYKNQLQEECEELYGGVKCMLEKLAYPVLIASHIKPFIISDDIEAYDPNNGLLLSRTLDSLFDLKYISFDDSGNMLKSKRLSDDVWQYWKDVKLDSILLNNERKRYLAEHRKLMEQADAPYFPAPLPR